MIYMSEINETKRGRGRPSKNAKSYHMTLPVDLKEWADGHTEGREVDGLKDSTSWLIQRLLLEYRDRVEATEALAEKRARKDS